MGSLLEESVGLALELALPPWRWRLEAELPSWACCCRAHDGASSSSDELSAVRRFGLGSRSKTRGLSGWRRGAALQGPPASAALRRACLAEEKTG